jgi:hypothetical protein
MNPEPNHNSVLNRLQELRSEYARGQAQMSALKRQQQELQDTLLRISGAILVLEELSHAQEPAPISTG